MRTFMEMDNNKMVFACMLAETNGTL